MPMLPRSDHWGLVVLGIAATVCPALGAPGDVARSFQAPCRYPAGLASDGTHLYLLDWREARLYQIDPADGSVSKSWDAPTLKPHGLAAGDGRLFIADDHSGKIYALNPESGMVDWTFAAPGKRVSGLAWVSGHLFILERGSRKIYEVLPDDGTILGYFDLPDRNCTCLTYDGRHLWAANRIADELYMLTPDDGTVLGILDAPGPHAAGVAWHDGYLWNVDFQTRQLYQLKVRDTPMYRLTDTRRAHVEYLWTLYNYGPGEVRDLRVNVAVPVTLPNQKLLSEPEYACPAAGTRAAMTAESDCWGQPCRCFQLEAVAAGQKAVVSYGVDVEVAAIRYLIIPEETGTLDDIPAEIREAYTADGSRYRLDSPFIQDTVRRVVGDEKNPYWIARRIFNHVIGKLDYEMVGGWDVPEVVLRRGSGSCSEYTFAFIALCRAAGLPARYQGSVVVRGDDASVDEAFHRWAQVYLPNYGWVPVDANRGDARSPADQARGFGELANRFLITTQGGGDSEYLRWGYNSDARYSTTGYCHLEEDNLGFWEPLADVPETGATNAAPTSQPAP